VAGLLTMTGESGAGYSVGCGCACGDRVVVSRCGRLAGRLSVRPRRGRDGGRDGYRALAAQKRADMVARRPKVSKLVSLPRVAEVVTGGLVRSWSPAAVAARLRFDHHGDIMIRVSPETIDVARQLDGTTWPPV
jgi:transposase, IS30 family